MSIGLPSNNTIMQEKGGRVGTPWYGFFQQLVRALLIQGNGTPGNLIVFTGNNNGTDGGPVPIGGITQLTGPVTAGPGSGSQTTTITPTGVTAGSYIDTSLTVNAAGQITAASNGTGSADAATLAWLGL